MDDVRFHNSESRSASDHFATGSCGSSADIASLTIRLAHDEFHEIVDIGFEILDRYTQIQYKIGARNNLIKKCEIKLFKYYFEFVDLPNVIKQS